MLTAAAVGIWSLVELLLTEVTILLPSNKLSSAVVDVKAVELASIDAVPACIPASVVSLAFSILDVSTESSARAVGSTEPGA